MKLIKKKFTTSEYLRIAEFGKTEEIAYEAWLKCKDQIYLCDTEELLNKSVSNRVREEAWDRIKNSNDQTISYKKFTYTGCGTDKTVEEAWEIYKTHEDCGYIPAEIVIHGGTPRIRKEAWEMHKVSDVCDLERIAIEATLSPEICEEAWEMFKQEEKYFINWHCLSKNGGTEKIKKEAQKRIDDVNEYLIT